jgi:N4-(beta-N-acetylglucosaminyl)-L-asparaginase
LKFILCNFVSPSGIDKWAQRLLEGMHRHDVLEGCLREMEADEKIDSVGYGGFPNIVGEMELDASFMNGNDRAIGAVAAVKRFLPIGIARRLMEMGPHVLLTGDGAERFAADCGLHPEPTLSPAQAEKWKRDIKPKLQDRASEALIELVDRPNMSQDGPSDTVVMVVSDGQGLSCANSTSGWPWKHPGRLGDAPIPGAGFYVDSRYGWCGCTHTGELAMRCGTARYVVAELEGGSTVWDAVDNAIQDLTNLTQGLADGVTVYAVDRLGNTRVVALDVTKPVRYWYWSEAMTGAECRIAERASSSDLRNMR